ncbi:MAG: hypothetical protein R3D55_28290 [Chloroflexota bacterium]
MALGVAVATAVLTLIPYWLGNLLTPDNLVYMQLIMNPEDAQTYWAKMLQGFDGAWLYTIPFTPEPHAAAGVGVFYVWLGQLARGLGVSLTAVWHGSRFVASIILFLTTFHFVAAFLADRRARWTAYLLAIFGSGLGWLLFVLGQNFWLGAFPVDFKQPGAHLFFTALTFPHISLGTAVILLDVLALNKICAPFSVVGNRWRWAVLAGLANVILGSPIHFDLHCGGNGPHLHPSHHPTTPHFVANWLANRHHIPHPRTAVPLLFVRLAQQRSVPPVGCPGRYARRTVAPLPGCLWATAAAGRAVLVETTRKTAQFTILWLWIFTAALLLYSPAATATLHPGVHVPLAVLAAAGFVDIVLPRWQNGRFWQKLINHPRYTTPKLRRFVIIFLLGMSLSNIYLWLDVTRIAVLEQPDLLFRPAAEMEAINWLRENGEKTAVLLGSYQTGNLVAAQAGQRVMLGHWAETVNFVAKETAVNQFFAADTSNTWRKTLLTDYSIDIVWYGPREEALGDFNPTTADFLTPAYQNDAVTIFYVLP